MSPSIVFNDTESQSRNRKLQWQSFSNQLYSNWYKGHLTLYFSPLHPKISMHILHTVLYTFPKVLTRRICSKIKSSFSWWLFNIKIKVVLIIKLLKLLIIKVAKVPIFLSSLELWQYLSLPWKVAKVPRKREILELWQLLGQLYVRRM